MASYEEEKAAANAKKNQQKIGVLKQKCVKYFWGSQIIRFEKKCFGWHYVGRDVDVNTEYTLDYDAGKIRKNTKVIKYAYFTRPKIWQKNFLFSLTEILSNIISWLRRFMLNTIVIWIVLAILGPTIFEMPTMAYWIIGVFVGLFVLSFAFAGLGALWKKVFKIEEKTDKILLENGYTVWEGNEEELSDKN